jgi:type II secretory pathway pseudopilin PulG
MKIHLQKNQHGQTLIETVVAVFILVMGISAALGLANYSLNATTDIRKQIIAMGLAREGIEAVKNMRDSNWLQAPISTTCWNFTSSDATGTCYPYWLDPGQAGADGYGLDPGAYQNIYPYVIYYDVNSPETAFWYLTYRAANNNYGLNYDSSANPSRGIYSAYTPTSAANATSDYARKITLQLDHSVAPFNQDATTGPRLKVTSYVWWKGKSCPISEDVPANSKCVIKLETYLTNWKDY